MQNTECESDNSNLPKSPCAGQIQDSSSVASLPNGKFCRICHETSKEEELFSHCHCKGSVGLVHSSCLLYWIKKSGSVTCELCNEKYSTITHMNKMFWKWKFPHIGTRGWLKLAFFFGFLSMLITFTAWIIWSRISPSSEAKQERSKRQIEYTYLVYGLLSLIAVVGMYAINFRPFINYISKCIVINQNIAVIPKGELCKDKSSKENERELDTKQDNNGNGSRKISCKHNLGILKDTCVQVHETEPTKCGLNRYIKFGGDFTRDISIV